MLKRIPILVAGAFVAAGLSVAVGPVAPAQACQPLYTSPTSGICVYANGDQRQIGDVPQSRQQPCATPHKKKPGKCLRVRNGGRPVVRR